MPIFDVGSLAWKGHDFLDKIREDTVWKKTKQVIAQKGLPMILGVIKDVSTIIISSAAEEAMTAILKGGM